MDCSNCNNYEVCVTAESNYAELKQNIESGMNNAFVNKLPFECELKCKYYDPKVLIKLERHQKNLVFPKNIGSCIITPLYEVDFKNILNRSSFRHSTRLCERDNIYFINGCIVDGFNVLVLYIPNDLKRYKARYLLRNIYITVVIENFACIDDKWYNYDRVSRIRIGKYPKYMITESKCRNDELTNSELDVVYSLLIDNDRYEKLIDHIWKNIRTLWDRIDQYRFGKKFLSIYNTPPNLDKLKVTTGS